VSPQTARTQALRREARKHFRARRDHITPLELGGAHCVKNLMPMTYVDHIEKTSKINAGLIAAARRRKKAALTSPQV
jgi:hypothetical protein